MAQHPQNQRVLGVFAKQPLPGQVKTRLAAAASPEWAARVAAAFLADCLDRFAGLDARRIVAFAWGHCTVLAQTVARVAGASLRLALLPPWYDVDTLDDWRMLCGHVAALRCAGIDPGVPRTEQLCLAEPE